jgi:hypothetical protein
MSDKFETWGVVELFGRHQLAGRISEQVIAGVTMLRVDIPDKDDTDKFRTVYHGGAAIYGVHPTDETVARAAASAGSQRPAYEYQVEDAIRRLPKPRNEIQQEKDDFEEEF